MKGYRAALALTLVSLTLWTAWNYARPLCHPYNDYSCGAYTDHFSHVNLARLFTERGFEIYQGPRGELARLLSPEEDAALPEDLRGRAALGVDEWPDDKPFLSSWPQIASFYPPGDLVMFAPVAAAYSFTDMSFTRMNLVTIELLILYAHVTVFLMLLAVFRRGRADAVDGLALLLAYLVVMRWTIDGFYDGGWIAPLVAAPLFLARGAGLPAVTAFAGSFFAHYRAAFLLPWALQGAFDFVRRRQWSPWTRGNSAMAAATVVMGALSATTFLMAREAMTGHQMTNIFNPSFEAFQRPALAALVLVTAPGAAVFAWKRSWLDLATAAWVVLLIARLPEINPWDAIALVPWLVAPALAPGETSPLVRNARAATAVLVMGVVFTTPLDLRWITGAIAQLVA